MAATSNTALGVLISLSSLVRSSWGHGAVTKPLPRAVDGQYYCPWCNGGHYPDTNPYGSVHRDARPSTGASPCLRASRGNQRYTAQSYGGYSSIAEAGKTVLSPGETFDATIALDADHNGDAIWSLCSSEETEDCFANNPISNWEDVHKYWSGDGINTDIDHWKSGEHYPQQVRIPSNTPSGPATLRWLWICKYTDEIFTSCIDVDIRGGGFAPTPTTPTPTTTTSPQAEPTTSPTLSPTAPPSPQRRRRTASPTSTPTSSRRRQGATDSCRNQVCGCPPFTSGASWCTESNSLYSEWCQRSEVNCGICGSTVWCEESSLAAAEPARVRRHTFLSMMQWRSDISDITENGGKRTAIEQDGEL